MNRPPIKPKEAAINLRRLFSERDRFLSRLVWHFALAGPPKGRKPPPPREGEPRG